KEIKSFIKIVNNEAQFHGQIIYSHEDQLQWIKINNDYYRLHLNEVSKEIADIIQSKASGDSLTARVPKHSIELSIAEDTHHSIQTQTDNRSELIYLTDHHIIIIGTLLTSLAENSSATIQANNLIFQFNKYAVQNFPKKYFEQNGLRVSLLLPLTAIEAFWSTKSGTYTNKTIRIDPVK
ncbi:MAG: hypothetical protein KDD34_09805, partial [Bdellovibrionales bacterium]|nr:hypothetical protein [Bdellovibrionales bacterium]